MENLINQKLLGFFLKYKKVSYRKGEYVIQAEEEPAGILRLRASPGILRRGDPGGDGPFPLLLILGTHAHSNVSSHRHMGRSKEDLCCCKIFHIYDGRQRTYANCHYYIIFFKLQGKRGIHI